MRVSPGKPLERLQVTAKLIDALREQLRIAHRWLPSSRCLPHPRLAELVRLAKGKVDSHALRRSSAIQLIQLLQDAGVVTPIPLQPGPTKGAIKLYSVGFEPYDVTIPAVELLQAYAPEGVLCYFSAIELHDLSTQPAPHYHVALKRAESKTTGVKAARQREADRPHPLGTKEFSSGGVDFYVTRRDATNLRAVQRRQLNPHCVVRVTTIEQTLLDCLHRPHSVGGASVVFEAWENAAQRVLPEKILALGNEIGDRALLRRVGYMLERFFPHAAAIAQARQEVGTLPDGVFPSLLPGIPFSHVNKKWGLRAPQAVE